MTPFDGPFAYNYVLPLAEAAYATSISVHLTQAWEIIAEAPHTVANFAGESDINSKAFDAYRAMVKHPAEAPSARASHMSTSESEPLVDTPPNLHFGWVFADTTTNTLTIAIRGTQYFKEWLEDFYLQPVPYQPVPGNGVVHAGFQIVYLSIQKSLKSILKEARARFPAIHTLLITGHSLGAAVVGIGAPDLLLGPGNGLTPLVYTFAEPRVGHLQYKDFYDATVPVCYRINNVWDIVPHAPPFLFLYIHEGQQLDIDSGFSFSVAHNHQLTTGYEPGLRKWVNDHPAVPALADEPITGVPVMIGVAP